MLNLVYITFFHCLIFQFCNPYICRATALVPNGRRHGPPPNLMLSEDCRFGSVGYLMRKTYLCVLKQKVERFNKEFATKEFDGWFDSKYHPLLNEGKLKGIAAGCDSVGYKQWKDEYEVKEPRKTPTSKTFELSTLDQDIELTFKSERKLATLTQLVELAGRAIDDMRSAMVDTSF
ncbi:unnamed protein product [Phytophthora lilii]|uniref:Unnamed protein product n=1 Tax=Phytophthora lilii TaxID=2077276 RepID=A0A9W6U0F8_9STRA|nr:unnamed protein product [Phytophthora lilii]